MPVDMMFNPTNTDTKPTRAVVNTLNSNVYFGIYIINDIAYNSDLDVRS